MREVRVGDIIVIKFETIAAGSGSVTISGLAVTDIEVYKGSSMVQRASDAGYALLDTDGIDLDGITGIHGFSIDLSDNTDAGFYAVGSEYTVVVSSITVDSQTVSFIAEEFRIIAAEAVAGKPKVDVDAWLGTAAAAPSVAGVPEVDITHVAGDTGAAVHLAKMVEENDTGRLDVAATSISDTGINSRLDEIRADTDTGIQSSVNVTSFADTGINDRLAKILADTDTGIQPLTSAEVADAVWDEADTGHGDTGSFGRLSARTAKIAADTDTGIAVAADTGAIVEAVWNAAKVDGFKTIEALRAVTAASAGKISGAGSGTETFTGLDDATTRLVATVDSSGNRTAISRTLDT